ncbi:MAG: hypothetical protein MSS82_06775 [Bacteroidales bacterium]|nr:hypothetical protein [Bacteroidales bacterium]
MKKGLLFGSGFLSGVIVTIIVLVIIGLARQNNGNLTGAKMFDEPGKVVNEKSFKVLQVIHDNAALVYGKDQYGDYWGTLYLITNNNNRYYYDDEIIEVPKGKCVRQLGIYKYQTKSKDYKTVPIIGIRDK